VHELKRKRNGTNRGPGKRELDGFLEEKKGGWLDREKKGGRRERSYILIVSPVWEGPAVAPSFDLERRQTGSGGGRKKGGGVPLSLFPKKARVWREETRCFERGG